MHRPDDDFTERLVENAFNFLEKAIDEIESDSKYSVIHFCAGVELFLKARLVHEHWSLVVTSHPPKLVKFRNGDFRSLGFQQLIPAIRAVTGENIRKNAERCFQQLASHRNKVMHFYHAADDPKRELEEIAVEQFAGWLHLIELLADWSFLASSKKRLYQVTKRLEKHDRFLGVVFQSRLKQIHDLEAKGVRFFPCPSCNKMAYRQHNVTSRIYEYVCLVCRKRESKIEVECSDKECRAPVSVDEDDVANKYIFCPNCSTRLSVHSRLIALDEDRARNGTQPEDRGCAKCSLLNSVIKIDGRYVCTNCLDASHEIERCYFCSFLHMDNSPEYSITTGCPKCRGEIKFRRIEVDP